MSILAFHKYYITSLMTRGPHRILKGLALLGSQFHEGVNLKVAVNVGEGLHPVRGVNLMGLKSCWDQSIPFWQSIPWGSQSHVGS